MRDLLWDLLCDFFFPPTFIFWVFVIDLFFLALIANFNALLDLLQFSFKILKSIIDAFPPDIADANRAYPHECAVWFGRLPLEKYAPCPFLTILESPLILHLVAFASCLEGLISATLYMDCALVIWLDFLDLKPGIFFLVWYFFFFI